MLHSMISLCSKVKWEIKMHNIGDTGKNKWSKIKTISKQPYPMNSHFQSYDTYLLALLICKGFLQMYQIFVISSPHSCFCCLYKSYLKAVLMMGYELLDYLLLLLSFDYENPGVMM